MSSVFNSKKHPHRRYNPLLDEWILVSPQRSNRPWQGQTEKTIQEELPAYDSECYLCPGNIRANGEKNPDYQECMFLTMILDLYSAKKLNFLMIIRTFFP